MVFLSAELQASIDGLLTEKLQLEQRVQQLTDEQEQLRQQVHHREGVYNVHVCQCASSDFLSQLAVEVEEKEALLRRINKQSKTMNKMKHGKSSSHQ